MWDINYFKILIQQPKPYSPALNNLLHMEPASFLWLGKNRPLDYERRSGLRLTRVQGQPCYPLAVRATVYDPRLNRLVFRVGKVIRIKPSEGNRCSYDPSGVRGRDLTSAVRVVTSVEVTSLAHVGLCCLLSRAVRAGGGRKEGRTAGRQQDCVSRADKSQFQLDAKLMGWGHPHCVLGDITGAWKTQSYEPGRLKQCVSRWLFLKYCVRKEELAAPVSKSANAVTHRPRWRGMKWQAGSRVEQPQHGRLAPRRPKEAPPWGTQNGAHASNLRSQPLLPFHPKGRNANWWSQTHFGEIRKVPGKRSSSLKPVKQGYFARLQGRKCLWLPGASGLRFPERPSIVPLSRNCLWLTGGPELHFPEFRGRKPLTVRRNCNCAVLWTASLRMLGRGKPPLYRPPGLHFPTKPSPPFWCGDVRLIILPSRFALSRFPEVLGKCLLIAVFSALEKNGCCWF
jgi:hypothetical protein